MLVPRTHTLTIRIFARSIIAASSGTSSKKCEWTSILRMSSKAGGAPVMVRGSAASATTSAKRRNRRVIFPPDGQRRNA